MNKEENVSLTDEELEALKIILKKFMKKLVK